jgi:hypothetical protein
MGDATIIAPMDELGIKTKFEIVKLVFPDLRYGGDPDIERYFELRKERRLADALSIYNRALRVRYPDDAARILLLKLYREHDPRYAVYQQSLILDFAAKTALRIRRNIDLITAPLERADLSDALHALKAVESVLARLPGETEKALALLERYDRFARALDYRSSLVRRAFDLVREYDAVSRADSPADYDFVARSAAIEERRHSETRQASRGASNADRDEAWDFVSKSAELERHRREADKRKGGYFDASRITFSDAEKARVEIPPSLTRREDRVLAFCAKYWPLAGDAAFERMVFLYSRKYGGRHFEIFRAIKIGRSHGASDDEILSAVSAILTTSYSYSVSGDLYMQIMWRRMRARMEAHIVAVRLAAPGPVAMTRTKSESAPESKVFSKRVASQGGTGIDTRSTAPLAAGDEPPTSIERRHIPTLGFAPPPSFAPKEASSRVQAERHAPSPTQLPPGEAVRPVEARSRPAEPPLRSADRRDRPIEPRSRHQIPSERLVTVRQEPEASSPAQDSHPALTRAGGNQTLRPTTKPTGARLLGGVPSGPEPIVEIRATRGSISDIIRKLSGRSYDVYREIFLEKVRDHIHRTLMANQTKSHGLFDTAANEAEDQIYGFIAAHYDDPFMDWEHSVEREAVEALGFSQPSLLPIIESCYKKL